eukprot:COSAG02_NODE_39170_length_420_cov_0.862928_1_plen_26_part_01
MRNAKDLAVGRQNTTSPFFLAVETPS